MDIRLTHSEDETLAVAVELASGLTPGDVLLISGDLGAGKTAFVRGVAAGLGIDPDEVSSPTFTLVHEYRGGRVTLFHADLYRLKTVGTEELGLEDARVAHGVLAIEWPDRLAHPMRHAVTVEMEIAGETARRIAIATPSDSSVLPS